MPPIDELPSTDFTSHIVPLEDIHFAQVRSYLKATRLGVGLLLNFNAPKLVIKRVVLSDPSA